MRNHLSNTQKTRTQGCLLTFALLAACATAQATDSPNLNGQWIGRSLLEGSHNPDKTSLSLGTPDSEGATLSIESSKPCTLRQGTYSVQQNGDGAATWSLSFKDSGGGEACARLARGNFSLRSGSTSRKIEFDVTYPGPDGQENKRTGVLSRYP